MNVRWGFTNYELLCRELRETFIQKITRKSFVNLYVVPRTIESSKKLNEIKCLKYQNCAKKQISFTYSIRFSLFGGFSFSELEDTMLDRVPSET